jgi:hypothetical protein
MSAYRRIPDAAPDGAEGRHMTQLGHSAYSRFQPRTDVRRFGGTATARIGWFDGGIGRIHIKWLSFSETEKEREAPEDATLTLFC